MRLPTRGQSRAERPTDRADDGRSSGTGPWWKILFALALGAIAYLAWRRRSGEPVPWTDEEGGPSARGRDETGVPGGREVPIQSPTEAGGEAPEETASGVDPTLEEVDERVESDVEEAPAEPGTVTVDEDVAEEAGEVEPEEDETAEDEASEEGSDAAGEDESAGEDEEE